MSTTIITDEMQAALTAQIESDLKSIGSNIDNLLAERDALRAVLREIVVGYRYHVCGFIGDKDHDALIERAEKLVEGAK